MSRVGKKLRLPVNGFMIGLGVALAAAWIHPEAGARGGWLQPGFTLKLGVFAIFVIQGLLLPVDALSRSVRDIRLHIVCQGGVYIVFPALALAVVLIVGSGLSDGLRMGLLFMAALPTTLTTASVFTARAGGDVGGAIFNIALSNMAGAVIVPLAAAWIIASASANGAGALSLLGKTATLLVLPFVVGGLLRRRMPERWIERRRKSLMRVNVGIVFFQVYCAFSDSFASGAWEGRGLGLAGQAFAAACALALAQHAIVWALGGAMRLKPSARIAAFCVGSQKTLAAGVPMAHSFFVADAPGMPPIGVLLLPLICYHPVQLLLGAWAIERLRRDAFCD